MRALQIAATGMSAQQMRVDTVANNLANMSTTGYNARRAEFADLHYQQHTRAGSISASDGTIVPIEAILPLDPLNLDGIPGAPCCHVDCPGGPSPECEYVCGDGVVEGPELCDPCPETCSDDDACTFDRLYGVPYLCWAACLSVPVGCRDDDGCCNSYETFRFCNNLNDNDCPPPPGDVGSFCQVADQCTDTSPGAVDEYPDAVECVSQQDFGIPGGYCTRTTCSLTGCPTDSNCVQGLGGDALSLLFGACLQSCDSDADCRQFGYACYDVDGDGSDECWLSGTGSRAFGQSCTTVGDCAGGNDVRCIDRLSMTGETTGRICSNLCDIGDPDGPDCPDGYRCYITGCQPAPEPQNVGGPCRNVNDCGGDGITGNRCLSSLAGYRNGYCTSFALLTECPPGSHEAGGEIGGCAKTCNTDADCRGLGYACEDIDGDNVRECVKAQNGTARFGDSCTGDWDCGDHPEAFCYSGTCNRRCFVDPNACPSGFGCMFATCERTCTRNSDCGPGGYCLDFGLGSFCL